MGQPTLVKPGSKIKLADYDPGYCAGLSKKAPEVAERREAAIVRTYELQEKLWAEGERSLLLVLQAMDAGGKDGTIRHVMRGLNPQGVMVSSFKVPNSTELAHDFLWRIHRRTPGKGFIGVFNRSHYEDVLVVRVKNLVPKSVWKRRYDQINEFEELLSESGTRILKLYLHISKDEQKERLQARLDNPDKHWKFSSADLAERARWDDYMEAFEEMLERCSTDRAPWHVIPSDRKWYRNLVVAELVRDTLADMDPQWPDPEPGLADIVIE
jgi:PPK2 family polyphosphate:nucleotide phosphotransferase